MPTITKKQMEEYERLRRDRDNGRVLTPDGLRFICEANGYDPEKIEKHILKMLPRVLQKEKS
ncbi:MAG: cytochrome C [Eubacteriales bacterium]|nr:cytochrome C [Eubacteriales bacterium]